MSSSPVSLADLLAEAEAIAPRSSPVAAAAAAAASAAAVICDVRSTEARSRYGVIPGSLHVPATVLLWRLEPGGAWRTPHVAPGARVLVVCDHGCSSLLLAAQLGRMGVDASDIVGGIEAWARAGLPLVKRYVDAPLAEGELPGTRGPASAT